MDDKNDDNTTIFYDEFQLFFLSLSGIRERERERVERRGSSWSQLDRARCREGKEELEFPIEVPPLMWPPLP